MIALGIDPGLASCGWAAVEASPSIPKHWYHAGHTVYRLRGCGTFHTKAGADLADRLTEMSGNLHDRRMANVVAVEALEVRRQRGEKINPAGLYMTAMVVGIAVGHFGGAGLRPLVRASEWRKAIGAGHGTPAEVRAAVERFLGPVKGSVHAVDACGIALWALAVPR